MDPLPQRRILFFAVLFTVNCVSTNDSVSCDFDRGLCGWTIRKQILTREEKILCGLKVLDESDKTIFGGLMCWQDFYFGTFPWEVINKSEIQSPLDSAMENIYLKSKGNTFQQFTFISELSSPEIKPSFSERCLTYNSQVNGKARLAVSTRNVDSFMQTLLALQFQNNKMKRKEIVFIEDQTNPQKTSVNLPTGEKFKILFRAIYSGYEPGSGAVLVDNIEVRDGLCTGLCSKEQFTCTDTSCIPVDHVGNSVKDCRDGSDEEDINTNTTIICWRPISIDGGENPVTMYAGRDQTDKLSHITSDFWRRKTDVEGHCNVSLNILPQECYHPEITLKESNKYDCYEVVFFSNCKTYNNCTSNEEYTCLFRCPQSCICKGFSFKCNTPNVPKIARSIDISFVDLRNNTFPVSSFRFLVHLNLSNCGLSTFEFHTIPNKLQVLDLRNNYIKNIDADFIGRKTLVFIFDNNPLERAVEIWNLSNVMRLQMRNISLHKTLKIVSKEKYFDRYLDFSYNNITSVGISIYTRLMLNLSHNEITMEDLPHVKILDMSFNRIKICAVSSSTEKIFLQNNQLIKFVKSQHGHNIYFNLLRFIDIGDNAIEIITRDEIKFFQNLVYINLKRNKISEIKHDTFLELSNLQYLDLSENRIETVEAMAFHPLASLQTLYMQGNLLTKITAKLFENLSSLTVLDLSFNIIKVIEKSGFEGLRNLKRLYIQSNQFKVYETIFSGMNVLTYLEVSDYTLCCAKPVTVTTDQCVAPKNAISSCDRLVDVPFLGIMIWYMAPLALFGNFAVIIYRAVSWHKSGSKTQSIFTMNLSFADLLMGVYLFVIAFIDLLYKGKYGFQDDTWRHSPLCTLSGIIATLSSESSAFHVLLITLDRVIVLRSGLSGFRISKKMAKLISFITWCLCLTISVLPAIEKTYFTTFYSRSGICISLPLSIIRNGPWEYSMVIFIGVNFLLFLGVLIGQILIFMEVISVGRKVQTEQSRKREISLAKTLFAVVITDLLCWIPIGIIGMVTLFGVDVSSTVYAWILVVVLPLNSALNPFLYTLVVYIREKKKARKKSKDATGCRNERFLKRKKTEGIATIQITASSE